jgi:hypothetical protein
VKLHVHQPCLKALGTNTCTIFVSCIHSQAKAIGWILKTKWFICPWSIQNRAGTLRTLLQYQLGSHYIPSPYKNSRLFAKVSPPPSLCPHYSIWLGSLQRVWNTLHSLMLCVLKIVWDFLHQNIIETVKSEILILQEPLNSHFHWCMAVKWLAHWIIIIHIWGLVYRRQAHLEVGWGW